MRTSNALDLERRVFTKSAPFRSAMSMHELRELYGKRKPHAVKRALRREPHRTASRQAHRTSRARSH